jgi:hypothetical protein
VLCKDQYLFTHITLKITEGKESSDLTQAINYSLASLVLILVASVVDSGCKPVTGVGDTGGKLLPVSLTPAMNIKSEARFDGGYR